MEEFLEIVLVKEVVQPILIISISFVIYVFINRMIKKLLNIKTKKVDFKKKKTILSLVRSVVRYVIIGIDILLILSVYGVDTKAILASLGVVGLVIGLRI